MKREKDFYVGKRRYNGRCSCGKPIFITRAHMGRCRECATVDRNLFIMGAKPVDIVDRSKLFEDAKNGVQSAIDVLRNKFKLKWEHKGRVIV